MDLLDILFLPLQPFVWNPTLIAIVAGLLFASFFVIKLAGTKRGLNPWPLLIPAALWALWIPWEAMCKAQGANIRVDLLLLYPLIVGTTIFGIVLVFKLRKQ